MLLYFKYRANMRCCDHMGLNSTKKSYLSSYECQFKGECCCISFLNAPTCNEIPMEYPVPNMLLKILRSIFFDKTMLYERIPYNLVTRS